MGKTPDLQTVLEVLAAIVARINTAIEGWIARQPEGFKPTEEQILALIRDTFTNVDLAALEQALTADVFALVMKGKSFIAKAPVDLA